MDSSREGHSCLVPMAEERTPPHQHPGGGGGGQHLMLRLAHPIGYARADLWQVAPEGIGGMGDGTDPTKPPELSDERELLEEEDSEFDGDSDKDHDLDFTVPQNFAQVQDSKAAQKQELATQLIGDSEFKKNWGLGLLELLDKRTLLDLPMDRPMSGLVLDVSPIVRTYRKMLILKKAVSNHLPSNLMGDKEKGEMDTTDREDVTQFWNLMLDVIMEAVEGPMRSELLQNPSFWANQVREILENSEGQEMVDVLKTKDPHLNPLLPVPPRPSKPSKSETKSDSTSSDEGSSSYSTNSNNAEGTERKQGHENEEKYAGEAKEEFLQFVPPSTFS